MDDIDIQPRRRSIFPLLLGVLILILFVVVAIGQLVRRDEPPLAIADDPEERVDPRDPATPPARVERAPEPRPGPPGVQPLPGDAWTGDTERVTASLDRLVARDATPGLAQRMDLLRRRAAEMRAVAPGTTEHAVRARATFTAAVDVMDELRRQPRLAAAPQLDLQVEAARAAVRDVHPGRPLPDQRAEVRRFFDRMGQAIQTAERHQVD